MTQAFEEYYGNFSRPSATQIVNREKLLKQILGCIDVGITPENEVLESLEYVFRYVDSLEEQLFLQTRRVDFLEVIVSESVHIETKNASGEFWKAIEAAEKDLKRGSL